MIRAKVPKMAETELICKNMFEVDWQSSANIVYISNLCFPPQMNDDLTKEIEKAKSGTLIIVLKAFKEDLIKDFLVLDQLFCINMTWGAHEGKIYKRI